MIKSALLILTCLFLASCATLFNSKYKRVDVITSKPAILVCLNTRDTLFGREFTKFLKRGREPLQLVVISDTTRTTITEYSKYSAAWYANFLYWPWGLVGVFIDSFTPRRFTYPGYIAVDLEPKVPGEKKKTKRQIPTSWSHHRDAVTFSPLKLLAMANPGLEAGYERFITPRFGVKGYLAGLAPPLTAGQNYGLTGIGLGVEPRLYFAHTFRTRWFAGFKASWSHIRYSGTFAYVPADNNPSTTQPVPVVQTSRVDRTIGHLTPKVGLQFSDDRFIGEISFGIGMKYRRVVHMDKPSGTAIYNASRHPNIDNIIQNESDFMTVGLPASFMVGWRF